MSEIPASAELLQLAFQALDHGIGSVERGATLVPFSMTQTEDGKHLRRYVADTFEESIFNMRMDVSEASDIVRVAIAWDGYLTLDDGERTDAIFVEAQERGSSVSLKFAQRYRPGSRLRKVEPIGNATYLGEDEALLV